MTNVVRNLQCACTSDVEEILKFKILKVLRSKLHMRQLVTNKELKNYQNLLGRCSDRISDETPANLA
jgi:hypothetical protein